MTSSAHLQREADAARVGLADTLGQLRHGMAPSALSGEALALAKDTGLSLVKSLAEQARANPVPALLIGAGLAMLLTRTTGGDVASAAGSALKSAASTGADAARQAAGAAGQAMKGAAAAATGAASSAATAAGDAVLDTAERAATTVGQKVGALRERVSGEVEAAGEAASERYAAVRDKMHEAADQGRRTLHDRQDRAHDLAQEAQTKARSLADETSQSIKHLLEEQPILMAALGAALGAAVGAALPLSRQEKDLLGGVGASAVGAGREALSSAAGVLREEVAHADLGTKVSDLADKVVQGVANGASRN
ncbi:MAG TPA: hypothetical protein VK362_26420 [Reyranella sp.]|nr:hypothetical protein [Reyranella sp.]